MSITQPTQDEKTIAMLCHITGLISFIGPLIVWLLKKDESEFIDANGKQALNFQISIFIYSIVASMLIVLLIGIPLLVAIGLFSLVMIVLASVKALNGEVFEYPLSMKILK
jgi:uncharacterized Tic20 family protein